MLTLPRLTVRRLFTAALATAILSPLGLQTLSAQFDPFADSLQQPQPAALPGLDSFAAQPVFGAQPGLGALPGLGDFGLGPQTSEPPALTGSLGLLSDLTTSTEGTTPTGTGFTESFVFLFRDDIDNGIVRENYTQDEALQQLELEYGRLAALRSEPQPGQTQAPTGFVDRATVEWDFYFEQLQMYQEYVKKKVVPGIEDLPGATFDTSNFLGGVIEERQNLFEAFTRASAALQTELSQKNTEFYERLDQREDRRRNFLEWLDERQEELVAWAEAWGSNVEAGNFRAGNAVSRDQWYAGANYGNPNPMVATAANRTVVITKNPVETTPGVLNAVSGNLTPYDLLDPFGRPRLSGQAADPGMVPMQPGLVLLDRPQN